MCLLSLLNFRAELLIFVFKLCGFFGLGLQLFEFAVVLLT